MAQGSSKPKLDFIGIGFTKAGSTWVYKLLEEHPDIRVSRTKETNFFVTQNLDNKPENIKYLEEFFEGGEDKIRGEFSPMYINKDKALENIKRFYPDIKLLVILRNPADKRISEAMYNYRFKADMERADFDKILKDRFANTPPRSIYFEHLQKWMDHFPRENFHIMILEEMIADPFSKIADLYRFLGADESCRPESASKKANAAHGFRYPKLQKKLRNAHQKVKRYPRLAGILKRTSRSFKLKQRIMAWNRKEFQKPPISGETRTMLLNAHRQEIGKLEELLGRDLSVWK
jgi:hypothetical protein